MHYEPTDKDAYGTFSGSGISFFEQFLSGASYSDVVWMLIHEARHNLGQDHSGNDFSAVDTISIAFTKCSNAPLLFLM
jgi:hypothetical protein